MGEETEITDFAKAFAEDVLEETLDELLDRENTLLVGFHGKTLPSHMST